MVPLRKLTCCQLITKTINLKAYQTDWHIQLFEKDTETLNCQPTNCSVIQEIVAATDWCLAHELLSCCAHVIRHFLAGLCFCAALALHPSKVCDVPSVLIFTEAAPKLGFLPTLCWQLGDVPLKSIHPCHYYI